MSILRTYCILGLFGLVGCSSNQFSSFHVEVFGEIPITQSVTKTISLRNTESRAVQQLLDVGFAASGNEGGHFRIEKVMVGGRVVQPHDIKVPPGSSLNVEVTYQPRDLETTRASYGNVQTGQTVRAQPLNPGEKAPTLDKTHAIHRGLIMAIYDGPTSGIVEVELRGDAVAGPNGEMALPEAGKIDCIPDGTLACFSGKFLIDIPKLLSGGPMELEMGGPIPFHLSGSQVQLHMDEFPPVLLLLKGNGPGEPLEGQPVPAVSIVISGVPAVTATGDFDGSRIELSDVGFRVRVVVGKIGRDQMGASMPSIVDFKLEMLKMTTKQPLTDGHIVMELRTKLSSKPSGNPIFDEFLGGADIIVTLDGELL